jgi:hypothetical protein
MTPTMIFAVSLFTFFSTPGFLISLIWSLKNEGAFKMLSTAAGLDLQKTASHSPEAGKAMKFLLIDFTCQMAGFNLLAVLIIWIPFREGELWAWCALWSYPLMFAWHYFHYAKKTGFSVVQIVYGILSSAALLLTFTQFS